jgi:hypothetical protein
MSVDLTDLKVSGDAIVPLEFGGLLPSALGGATARIERMGDRYSVQVSTPPMKIEPDGRRWSARLMKARREGGIVEIHQPDLNIGAPGSPVVSATTANGRSIPVSGLTPYYAVREGQWFNYFDAAGQRYLEQAAEQVIADASGELELPLQNLLRIPLTAGWSINLAKPCIEGWIEGDFSIPRAVERITSFNFVVSEKA